jgi:hypothetical protein
MNKDGAVVFAFELFHSSMKTLGTLVEELLRRERKRGKLEERWREVERRRDLSWFEIDRMKHPIVTFDLNWPWLVIVIILMCDMDNR